MFFTNVNDFYVFLFKVPYYWIDLSDLQEEGIWKWMEQDVPAFYLNWQPGQPDNHVSNQDCGLIYKAGGWDDAKCDNSYHYICEAPKSE